MSVATQRLESFMPTEAPMYRVTDIDFSKWKQDGVELIEWDIEGTLGETGSEELELAYLGAIAEAREAGIDHHVLVTNFMLRTVADRRKLAQWGRQAKADLVFTPLLPSQAKPNPYMLLQAMNNERFQFSGAQTGMVGDKATSDMRAAYYAGIQHRAWTRPYGDNRHIGDRLVRDPFESALRVYAHLLHTPAATEEVKLHGLWTPSDDELLLASGISPLSEPDGMDNIVGYGLADVVLDQETLDSLHTPVFRQALQTLQEIANKYGEAPAEQLRRFLHEQGRNTATALTYGRLLLAVGTIAVNMSELDPRAKQKINAAIVTLEMVTDGLDGPSSRAHKEGATEKGGKEDQNIDKVVSVITDLFALLPAVLTTRMDIYLTVARDAAMTGVRYPFRARGMDTKSISSGKNATAIKLGAQIFALTMGEKFPTANRIAQRTATGLKIASMLQGPLVWIEKHESKQHEHNNLARLAVA